MSPEADLKSVEHLCLMNPEKDLRSGLPPQSSTVGSPHPGELWCVDGFGTGEALEKIHSVELVSWRGGLRIKRIKVKMNLYKIKKIKLHGHRNVEQNPLWSIRVKN